MEPAATIEALRSLLDAALRSIMELDAFCWNHFPEVYRRFTPAMGRKERVELLLRLAEPRELLMWLKESVDVLPQVGSPARFSPMPEESSPMPEPPVAMAPPPAAAPAPSRRVTQVGGQAAMAPPPAAAPAPLPDCLEDAFARLAPGWFAVDAPAEMTVGAAEVLSASAIRGQLQRALLESTLHREQRRIEETLLSQCLRVELVPDRAADFEVRPLSLSEQPVLGKEITLWEWLVTPLSAGERKTLRVLATNLLDVAGERVGKSRPVKSIEVRVRVQAQAPAEAQAQAAAPPPGPSRAALRRLLSQVLPMDSDLNAFCLDYFEPVYRRFTDGMDRVAKFNLLLLYIEGSALLAALREAHPEALARATAA